MGATGGLSASGLQDTVPDVAASSSQPNALADKPPVALSTHGGPNGLPFPAASGDNTGMSTAETQPAGMDPEAQADLEAVMQHVTAGTPVEPELAQRVRERSRRITEELRGKYGELNVAVDLVRESREGL